ncbi:MAG: DUF421 domain-containing protein [Sphingomonadaceae bacterium]
MEELAGIAVRASVIYLYVLATLRFAGKRTLGDLEPWDFLVVLILSDMFDDVLWGETPLTKAITGMTTVLLLHILVSYASFKSGRLWRLFGSGPTPIVRERSIVEEGLRRERMGVDTVRSQLRLRGVERLEAVREAMLEPSGDLSVLSRDEAKPAEKRDLPRVRRAMR